MSNDSALARLYDLAENQDGFFTTRQAAEIGVSRVAVKLAEGRGRLTRSSRGVYRLTRFPYPAGTAQLWEALLWPQTRSIVRTFISHESALVVHELSDANPTKVHITVPRTFRTHRALPPYLVLHYADLPDEDIELVNGLPVTNAIRTLRDISSTSTPATIASAVSDAQSRGIRVPSDLVPR
jgi:predicted transcriptional regulator of viral defense system